MNTYFYNIASIFCTREQRSHELKSQRLRRSPSPCSSYYKTTNYHWLPPRRWWKLFVTFFMVSNRQSLRPWCLFRLLVECAGVSDTIVESSSNLSSVYSHPQKLRSIIDWVIDFSRIWVNVTRVLVHKYEDNREIYNFFLLRIWVELIFEWDSSTTYGRSLLVNKNTIHRFK